jgi:hypothetical protein
LNQGFGLEIPEMYISVVENIGFIIELPGSIKGIKIDGKNQNK